MGEDGKAPLPCLLYEEEQPKEDEEAGQNSRKEGGSWMPALEGRETLGERKDYATKGHSPQSQYTIAQFHLFNDSGLFHNLAVAFIHFSEKFGKIGRAFVKDSEPILFHEVFELVVDDDLAQSVLQGFHDLG